MILEHSTEDLMRDVEESSVRSSFFENQLLSYKKAAQYLSVSEAYLRRLKARGHVPFVLVGDRAVRFRVSSLNHWIEEREVK
jgi:excisionase family DNA binding protein